MTDEAENVTNDETLGADEAETTESNATDGETSGADDINPDTGKIYTQAEVNEREKKLRQSFEKKLRKQAEREQAPPVKESVAPKPEDYKSVDDYNRAVVRHEIALAELQKEQERSIAETRREVNKMLREADELPGYDADVIVPYLRDLGASDAFADALLDSPHRAKILEHLSINEDDQEALLEMSDAKRIKWLGRLESRFETKPQKAVPDQKQAVNGGASVSNLFKTNPDVLSDAEYEAQYKKQRLERLRR